MINCTILNKSKPKTLLLVHGLFTSSGYWLSYLQSLKDYKLIILDIDYRMLRNVERYVSLVDGIIEAEAGGKVNAVISHSLGTMIARRLDEDKRQYSFEICPVYCAVRRNTDDFVREIQAKIKFVISSSEILELLAEVDLALNNNNTLAKNQKSHLVFLPKLDLYFSYSYISKYMEFSGDHFDIAEAINEIGRMLAK